MSSKDRILRFLGGVCRVMGSSCENYLAMQGRDVAIRRELAALKAAGGPDLSGKGRVR